MLLAGWRCILDMRRYALYPVRDRGVILLALRRVALLGEPILLVPWKDSSTSSRKTLVVHLNRGNRNLLLHQKLRNRNRNRRSPLLHGGDQLLPLHLRHRLGANLSRPRL
jgi:hypothetical protein